MNELVKCLALEPEFPSAVMQALERDFEDGYAAAVKSDPTAVGGLNAALFDYFERLRLPSAPNIYDILLLSLRQKDVIFTFNWDPFLVQARRRLQLAGVAVLPDMYFLHGNVSVGECFDHRSIGYVGGSCPVCRRPLEPLTLLYPIGEKNYQDGAMIEGQWRTAQDALANCFWFTIFGYSAPASDIEAVGLFKEAWHRPGERPFHPIEIIDRPGTDRSALYDAWSPLIFRDRYTIHESFFDSWIARHPRRTLEAYRRQFIEGEWIEANSVPGDLGNLAELIEWFRLLLEAERAAGLDESNRVQADLQ
jgi:hypothetical protein